MDNRGEGYQLKISELLRQFGAEIQGLDSYKKIQKWNGHSQQTRRHLLTQKGKKKFVIKISFANQLEKQWNIYQNNPQSSHKTVANWFKQKSDEIPSVTSGEIAQAKKKIKTQKKRKKKRKLNKALVRSAVEQNQPDRKKPKSSAPQSYVSFPTITPTDTNIDSNRH